MKKKLISPTLNSFILFLALFSTQFIFGQDCTISGLDPIYCESDDPVTLVGDPLGGFFSGPGMSGSTFDPGAAGVGVHTIEYELPLGGTGDKYYIKSIIGNPWGNTSNQDAMDVAFGPGLWTEENFESVDVASVFSASTGFVFIDGSDGQASELNTFLIANLPAIEDWVFAGGRLLLNSAPNEGGAIDFGFDGSTMVYVGGGLSNDVVGVDPAHPAFLGPELPTSTAMSGTWYTHSEITGVGFTPILVDAFDASIVGLCEKPWGAGHVMMGGMTTYNYHSPAPQAGNWRSNIMVYLYNMGGVVECSTTQEVEVIAAPDVTITADPDDLCEGESVIFTADGADSYTWSIPEIVDGVPYLPGPGPLTVSVTGLDDASGCDNTASVTIDVHALPVTNFDTDETSYCEEELVTFENLTTIADGADITYLWDFGDGSTSGDENPTHEYTDHGTYEVVLTATSEFGCEVTYTMDVVVTDNPIADFEFEVAGVSSEDGGTGGCVSNPVIFTNTTLLDAPEELDGIIWNFGDGTTSTDVNPTHMYDEPGTYTITLTVQSEGGCLDSYTTTITMTEGLFLDFVVNEPTCFGFSDASIIVLVEDESGDLIFSITDEDGDLRNIDNSNAANSLGSGWYYINVDDGTACNGEDSIFIDQPAQIDADLTIGNPQCYGDALGWARVDEVYNAGGDLDNISYIWVPNPSGVGGIGADSAWAMGEDTYILTINDDNGCSRDFTFEITEPDSLYFSEFGYDPAYCRLYDYQNGNGVVYAAAVGGSPDYSYLWTYLETGATSTNSTWGGRNPGTYEMVVTDENGCELRRTVVVDSLNPIANFTMTSAQFTSNYVGTADVEVVFENTSENFANPNNPSADTTFQWNFDHDNIPWIISHDYFEVFDTTYEGKGETYEVEVCLIAINKNGCEDEECKIIRIFEPLQFEDINVFTPNNDGANDVFTFEGKATSISEFYCVILDRWGVKIAELNDISDFWDGTDRNGSESTDGVYFYKYEAVTDNGTEIVGQGKVHLIRNQK
jgi:gliding motility-associated-like protein